MVTLSAANDLTVNEGTVHTYNYSVSDVDSSSFTVVSLSCGTAGTLGASSTNATGGSFQCAFPDGPDSSTVSVQVKDDANTMSNTATQTVTIDNVAPTVTISGAVTVDEGDTETYTFTVTDPGADTFTVTGVPDCGAAASFVAGSLTTTAGGGDFQCTFPDGPADTTLTVNVTDSDTAPGSDTHDVHVNNVAPTVTISGAVTVDEGDTETYTFTVTDPGADTFTVNLGYPNCGGNGVLVSGSLVVTASGGSFQCTFPDGDAQTTLMIKVTDSDGDSDVQSTNVYIVDIANVAPTVTISGAVTVDEGDTETYTFTVTDPGVDTFTVTGVPDCGAAASFVAGSLTTHRGWWQLPCTFPDGPADTTLTVNVTDSDTAPGSDTHDVHVNNVAPTVTISGAVTVDEGDTETYTFTVTDPGADTFTVTGVPDCGAAASFVAGSLTTTAGGGNFQCTFPDGPADTTLTVNVTDSDTAPGSDTHDVHVNNVAPTVTISASSLVGRRGYTQTYSFSVTDLGAGHVHGRGVPDCGAAASPWSAVSTTTTVSWWQFPVCTFADGPASTPVRCRSPIATAPTAATPTQTVTISTMSLRRSPSRRAVTCRSTRVPPRPTRFTATDPSAARSRVNLGIRLRWLRQS